VTLTILGSLDVVAITYMFRTYMKHIQRNDVASGVLNEKYQWMLYGIDHGWVRSYCATHDCWTTPEEEALYDVLDDPCFSIYRLTPD